MRVLGIDCGSESTGYGVVELDGAGRLVFLAAGAIRVSPRQPMAARLAHIYAELGRIIDQHTPTVAAIEDVFYAVNAKSALKLGQVRFHSHQRKASLLTSPNIDTAETGCRTFGAGLRRCPVHGSRPEFLICGVRPAGSRDGRRIRHFVV